MREIAVLGTELAEELVKAGFEVIRSWDGKYATVYYFYDTEELLETLEDIMNKIY